RTLQLVPLPRQQDGKPPGASVPFKGKVVTRPRGQQASPDESPSLGSPGSSCPDLEVLSAYVDGKLRRRERERVAEHISRCDSCYAVVRETLLTRSQVAEDAGLSIALPELPPKRKRGSFRHTFNAFGWVPSLAAASLVVAAGLFFAKERGLFL